MNAKELFQVEYKQEEGVIVCSSIYKSVNRWFCGKCGVIHKEKIRGEKCCKPNICACGAEVQEKYWLVCSDCRSKQKAAKEQERFDKAEKVTEWDGPIWVVDEIGSNDGYFQDVNWFYDCVSDEEIVDNEIGYAYCCDSVPVCLLDIGTILENATQEAYEGFENSDLKGVKELETAIQEFNEKNKGVVNWEIDYNRVLLLEKQTPNEELAIQP